MKHIFIIPAILFDTPFCDQIAKDCEKASQGCLGWVRLNSMEESIRKGMMNVARSSLNGRIIGFILWSKPSRGANKGWHVVHTLAVDILHQREGIGRVLLNSVPLPIRLKCPVEVGKTPYPNPANDFYRAMGFTLAGTDTTKKGKLLNVWEKRMSKKRLVTYDEPFRLSNRALEWLAEHGYVGSTYANLLPDDPLVVECFETLGSAAAGTADDGHVIYIEVVTE
jgi:GNAT superfamily N-acetyltransferase